MTCADKDDPETDLQDTSPGASTYKTAALESHSEQQIEEWLHLHLSEEGVHVAEWLRKNFLDCVASAAPQDTLYHCPV